jgi:L-ribulose-5-phosphate 4-epimerase
MLFSLKKQVYDANIMLQSYGIVHFTWGNASGICRKKNRVVIKPSGVKYEKLSPFNMCVLDLHSGKQIGGRYKPSSDTQTHLELYRRFPNIGGIVHTHSMWATMFAQAMKEIPALGTTHADYFRGAIPCTRVLSAEEIAADYELNTGKLIADTCTNPDEIPAVLVANHGPFAWGKNAGDAAHNAIVLEITAHMAWRNLQAHARTQPISQELLDKHFLRKHGVNSYYGQK